MAAGPHSSSDITTQCFLCRVCFGGVYSNITRGAGASEGGCHEVVLVGYTVTLPEELVQVREGAMRLFWWGIQ